MSEQVCGSCGKPATTSVTFNGDRVPVCLRHYNAWVTPPWDYTCPTPCVQQNHPGVEHYDWLTVMRANSDLIDYWMDDDDE